LHGGTSPASYAQTVLVHTAYAAVVAAGTLVVFEHRDV
jgi:hypothetical protein